MHVAINLLGGFEVVVDGRPVAAQAWTRRHAAALVKLLALRPGRRLPRDQVIDSLWPDLLLEQAAPRLHKAAHYARTALGVPTGVVLGWDVVTLLPDAQVTVDVERFERAASAHHSGGGVAAAEEAIDAYRGDLLPEDLYEPWTGAERERLRLDYLSLLRASGRWRELVAAEPLDEEAHLRLAHQHVAAGDRAQALRHLDSMAQLWRDELDTEPGPAALALRARAQAMPPVDDRQLRNPGATRVPRPATPTVGRDDDIDGVLDLLDRHQLVTLLGVGGVGKTRLAAEVAHRFTESTSQRACYVDLTKVRDAALVAQLTVRELGVRAGENQNAAQMLEEALRRQCLLVVLDNFEHVVDAADLVGEMVRWSPGLRVLVTSRARLRVTGERVFEVQPLSVDPEPGTTGGLARAVALFEQVAAAVDPRFELDGHLEDVEAICRSVDGLPLAIEIAGGHLRTLPPPLLRQRLASRLGSAVAAGRDLPGRHRTIPATIDWSLQLLGPEAQELFARLSVFEGPVPLEAVESVWTDGDVLDPLGVLVDQSLVRRTAGNRDEPRFGMLTLVREHAAQLLDDEGESVARSHAEYVAVFVEDLFERRWTGAAGTWLDDITEMLAEVRSAYDWATSRGDLPLSARIAAALGGYWFLEGHHAEGLRWVGEMLDREGELDPAVSARLHLAAGLLAFPTSQPDARVHWERAAALFRRLGETRLLAYSLAVESATYLSDEDRYAEAVRLNDEALELARRVGGPALIAQVLNIRGELTRVAGEDDRAQAAYEEGLQISRTIDDDNYVSVFLSNLSYLADHRGDYDEALRLTHESLRICWSLGRRLMAAWTISQLAGPEHGLGRSDRGAVLIGAADEALRVLGARRHPGDIPEHRRVVDGIRGALGDERFESLYAEGSLLSLDEALAFVLGEEGLLTHTSPADPEVDRARYG